MTVLKAHKRIKMSFAQLLLFVSGILIVVFWGTLMVGASNDGMVIQEIRLPRQIGAAAIGAALAVSGAIMQGMTRNPLADPGLMGLTAGANLALVLSLLFIPGLPLSFQLIVCFIGALIGVSMTYGISASVRGGFSPLRMALAGSAVTAFLFAFAEGVTLLNSMTKDASLWHAGGLVGTSWKGLSLVLPVIGLGLVLAQVLSRQLTLLSLSEEVAVGLGQNTLKTKVALMGITVLLAGAAVALAGNLAFVGLMVPHFAKHLSGSDYRRSLPVCGVLGAILLLLADAVARVVHMPYETPLSAVISVLGLPFFLWLVRRK